MKKFAMLIGLPSLLIAMGLIFCFRAAATPKTAPAENVQTGFSSHNFIENASLKLECDYLLYVPQDYAKSSDKWPLIIMLHGSGERGIAPAGLEKFGPFAAARKQYDFPFIVLGPVCPKGHWWSDATVTLSVMALIDDVCSKYNIDTNRIYLTGFSMGGFGTWNYAEQFPNKFAAIAPICGGGNPYRVGSIKHLPVMIFHGRDDKNVPFWQAQQMALSLSQVGGNVKFMMYPNTGHFIWDQIYSKGDIYSWFLQQDRRSNLQRSAIDKASPAAPDSTEVRPYTPPAKKITPTRINTRM